MFFTVDSTWVQDHSLERKGSLLAIDYKIEWMECKRKIFTLAISASQMVEKITDGGGGSIWILGG